MSRFLTYLGIPLDSSTPSDILQGGKIIDGLQMIYEDMPSGNKKDSFASMIAETASILMRRINTMKGVTNPKVEQELEEMEREKEMEKKESYEKEIQEMENEPNPMEDKRLDEVDPPIDKSVPPPTEQPEEDSDELKELIAQIHNLEF